MNITKNNKSEYTVEVTSDTLNEIDNNVKSDMPKDVLYALKENRVYNALADKIMSAFLLENKVDDNEKIKIYIKSSKPITALVVTAFDGRVTYRII